MLYAQWNSSFSCTEPTSAPDHLVVEPATSVEEEAFNISPEVCDPSGNEGAVIEDETVDPPIHSLEITTANEEGAPKKSYASIVSCC